MKSAKRNYHWIFLMSVLGAINLGAEPVEPMQWETLPDMPIGLGGQMAGISNGALVVIGGSYFPVSLFEGGTKKWVDWIDVLEEGATEWRRGWRLEHSLGYGVAFTTKDGIIIAGGANNDFHYSEVYRLQWTGGRIEMNRLPNLPYPIAFTSGVCYDNKLYIAGGTTTPKATSTESNFWCFDLSDPNARWQQLEPWPGSGRMLASVGVIDDAIYVIGGCSLHPDEKGEAVRTYLTDAYRYRLTGKWERIAELPRPTVAAPQPAVTYGDSQLIVLGGDTGELSKRIQELKDNHPGFPKEFLVYDVPSNQWSRMPGTLKSQATTTAVQWNGRVYIPGGEDRPGHRSPTIYVCEDASLNPQRCDFVRNGQANLVEPRGKSWISGDGYLECSGTRNLLRATRRIISTEFHIKAKLALLKKGDTAASFELNGNSHFGFDGSGGRCFVEGPFFQKEQAFFIDSPSVIQAGKPFVFEIDAQSDRIVFKIDGTPLYTTPNFGQGIESMGLRPWRSTMRVYEFYAGGECIPRRTMPTEIVIPTVDWSGDRERQVLIDYLPGTYLGHPDTLLLNDGKTILATYPLGHGGATVLKRSEDGGKTWSERIPVPANFNQTVNCPSLLRMNTPSGEERLLLLQVGPDRKTMWQSESLDSGITWTPFKPNGLHCVVPPISAVPIPGHQYLALYHRGRYDRDGRDLSIWQSIASEGGQSWSTERKVGVYPGGAPCEPEIIRSPDGQQLAVVMRENNRRFNSLLMTSNDNGKAWSELVELPAGLTGDRHIARYLPNGKLLMTFRDMAQDSPTRGDFVAWVGTYDDLIQRREGSFRIRLLDNPNSPGDTGYAGLELLPDGSIVSTTYCPQKPGEPPAIVSVRYTVTELETLEKQLWMEETPVFTSGEDGYHTYRIPAILVSQKGTLLAFCEGRKTSSSDAGDIDLLVKRSFDNGKTWEPQRIIWEDGDHTIGNPCPVVDRDTGTIWMPFCRNNDRVFITKSDDDGVTWANPVEITKDVKPDHWGWYATGPGVGIQLKNGRLLIPSDHDLKSSGLYESHAVYSDDHGKTWTIGETLTPHVNECQAVELVDDSLLMNMRAYFGKNLRAVSYSQNGGETWGKITLDPQLVEPVCQAGFLRYTTTNDSDKNRVLFSNPADRSRIKMTVRLSYEEGKTWAVEKLIYPGPSAYSCLVALPNRTVGCLYEKGKNHPYETITFARFPLEWLTQGKDTLRR